MPGGTRMWFDPSPATMMDEIERVGDCAEPLCTEGIEGLECHEAL